MDDGIKRDESGKFAKGTMGKPKGAISEKTKIWNEVKQWYTGEGLEAYQKLLTDMMEKGDDKQKAFAMQRYEAMMEYFAPKLSRVESKNETKVNLEKPIKWLDEK